MTTELWYVIGVGLVAMLVGADLGYTVVILRLKWGRELNPLYEIGKGWLILAANWAGISALIWGFFRGPGKASMWAALLGAWLLARVWAVRNNYRIIIRHAEILERAVEGDS